MELMTETALRELKEAITHLERTRDVLNKDAVELRQQGNYSAYCDHGRRADRIDEIIDRLNSMYRVGSQGLTSN